MPELIDITIRMVAALVCMYYVYKSVLALIDYCIRRNIEIKQETAQEREWAEEDFQDAMWEQEFQAQEFNAQITEARAAAARTTPPTFN